MNKRYLNFLPISALIVLISVLHFSFTLSIFYDSQRLFSLTNAMLVAGTGSCADTHSSLYLLVFKKEQR
jgi:hypothetical protein